VPNILNFALLGMITFATLHEPIWLKQYCQQLPDTKSKQTAGDSQNAQPITKTVQNWLNSWR
jgi:hypothetical protein